MPGLSEGAMRKTIIYKILYDNKYLGLFLFFGVIILSGCSRYEMISINSMLPQNEKKEFENGNDTVLIRYAFNGENLPLTITIYNKLLQPLYFDSQRSTVVLNNAQVNNVFNTEGQVSFIAPLSYVKITSYPLIDHLFKVNPKDSMIIEKKSTNMGMNFSFSEQTTPLFFRCIIALTVYEDYSNPTFFDYSFWVSDITRTYTNPNSRSEKMSNESYVRKETGVGKTFSFTGSILLLVILCTIGALGE